MGLLERLYVGQLRIDRGFHLGYPGCAIRQIDAAQPGDAGVNIRVLVALVVVFLDKAVHLVLQGVHVGGVARCLRSSIFLVQLLEIGFQRFHILILLGAGDQRAGDACRSVAQNRVKNRVRGGAERQGWGGIPLVCRGRVRIFVARNQIVPLLLQIGLLGSIARCNGCVILCL